MPELPALRLLAPSSEVGDLFTRLVRDVFEVLGFATEEPNVATAGREIDLVGRHREEPHRLLCVECKATAKAIGGDVLNKFAGVLGAERSEVAEGETVEGYVVSLQGFTGPALRQEKKLKPPRFTLYTGKDVVRLLEQANQIVSHERILEPAGRCAARFRELKHDPPQLLGHETGWIWAVVYRQGGTATHVALLLGADGEPLEEGLAQRILAADEKGPLAGLSYLAPAHVPEPPTADLARAEAEYLRYLVEHWSFLSFRGMGVNKLQAMPLTDLYIPLYAQVIRAWDVEEEGDLIVRRMRARANGLEEAEKTDRESLLEILAKGPGLVLLGHPGAGKSTFLKYVAVMLAQGKHEELGLPADRLPVLISLAEHAEASQAPGQPRPSLSDFFARRCVELLGDELPFDALLRRAHREGRVLWLLDGLDEVRGEAERLNLVRQIETLLATRASADNRFVLTSRIVGYDRVRLAGAKLRECRLAPLNRKEIEEFVDRWTAVVERSLAGGEREGARAAAQEREGLLRAIDGNPRIADLAANPLLLTILVLMKRQGVELPERRVLLYQNYVATLLSHWPKARSLSDHPLAPSVAREVNELRQILDPLALWMQTTAAGRGVVEEEDLRRFLAKRCEATAEDPGREADAFLEEVRETASLLVERGRGEYGFLHLTFQEFLAAAALASEREEAAETVVVRHAAQPEWHEVIQLAVGCLAVIQMRERVAGEVLQALLRERPGEPGQAVVLAGRSLADAGARAIPPAVKSEVVEALLQTLGDDGRVAPKLRAAAGKALAALGDPRPAAMTIEGLWENLCRVEAGPFWMGSDGEKNRTYGDERPFHKVELPYSFHLSRYPVTVEQFRQYVLASRAEPGHPGTLRDPANWPVRWVSWNEALAFCRWLTARWREEGRLVEDEKVTLPSEEEWEKAARGKNGWVFPWGNDEEANRMNYWRAGIGEPSAVGCFPGGVSLYGCEEMVGQVFEWTRSLYEPYLSQSQDGRETLSNPNTRVVRGGSFGDLLGNNCCAARVVVYLRHRGEDLGFRVAVVRASSSGP